jgi:hypothetical protein
VVVGVQQKGRIIVLKTPVIFHPRGLFDGMDLDSRVCRFVANSDMRGGRWN